MPNMLHYDGQGQASYKASNLADKAHAMTGACPGQCMHLIPVRHQDWDTLILIEFGTEITILWETAGSARRSCCMDIYDMSRFRREIRCPNLDDKRVLTYSKRITC